MKQNGISVVVPFYKGNQFLDHLDICFYECITFFHETYDVPVEIILVNDSPEISIEKERMVKTAQWCRFLSNEKNCGIQKTRVKGIREATQKYILLLDQDDDIVREWMQSQYAIAVKTDADVVVSNGYRCYESGNVKVFKNKRQLIDGTRLYTYIAIGGVISSPGMCLVKKDAIPRFWMENCLKMNNADDFYLWIIMATEGCSFAVNNIPMYYHNYTGNNRSLNEMQTILSDREVISLLYKYGKLQDKYLRFYSWRVNMREIVMFRISNPIFAKMVYIPTEILKRMYHMYLKYVVDL